MKNIFNRSEQKENRNKIIKTLVILIVFISMSLLVANIYASGIYTLSINEYELGKENYTSSGRPRPEAVENRGDKRYVLSNADIGSIDVFCIEPGVAAENGYIYEKFDIRDLNVVRWKSVSNGPGKYESITTNLDIMKEYFSIISYMYDKNYKNIGSVIIENVEVRPIHFRAASQMLIWEVSTGARTSFGSDKPNVYPGTYDDGTFWAKKVNGQTSPVAVAYRQVVKDVQNYNNIPDVTNDSVVHEMTYDNGTKTYNYTTSESIYNLTGYSCTVDDNYKDYISITGDGSTRTISSNKHIKENVTVTCSKGDSQLTGNFYAKSGDDSGQRFVTGNVLPQKEFIFTVITPDTILIEKKDESDNPLDGAVFAIYDDVKCAGNGGICAVVNGNEITYINLEPGLYGLGETTVPLGYKKMADREIEIKHGFNTFKYNNEPNSVTIQKLDENDNPLDGAVFTICHSENIGECYDITGNGDTVKVVSTGAYALGEKVVPPGYKKMEDTVIEVNPGHNTFTFHNEPNTVTIQKLDENDNLLDGAVFTICHGENIGECYDITGNGDPVKVVSTGTYALGEKVVPLGYKKMEDTVIEVNPGHNTFTFHNEPNIIEIKKIDENDNLLDGAVFTICHGENIGECYDIIGNGDPVKIMSTGAYALGEKVVPPGYKKMEDTVIVVKPGYNSFTFSNGQLEIRFHKEDYKTKERINNAGFKIYKENKEQLVKFDQKDDTECYKENENGNVEEVFTNTEGEVCLRNVTSKSKYIIEETTVPEGYQKIPDATITATDKENSSTDSVTMTLKDTPLEIKFYKEDSKTNQRMNNAGFKIYKNDVLVKFDARGTDGCYKENANGSVEEVFTDTSTNNGEVCLSYVTSGSVYTVKETTVPKGYQKMPDATITATDNTNTAVNVSQKGFIDKPLEIKFYKEDSKTNQRINNAGFKIYKNEVLVKFDARGTDGCYKENANGSVEEVFTDTSTNNGEVCLSYVTSGSVYTVKETTVPKGYQKMPDAIIIATDKNNTAENVSKSGFTDTPLEIKFYKVDSETGKKLDNAGFKIYKENKGQLVKFDQKDDTGCYKENANGSVEEVFTDTSINNGEVCLSYVTSKSEYIIEETTIPEGYQKMPDATIIAPDKEDLSKNSVALTLKDKSVEIKFYKEDSETGKRKNNAGFKIYKNNVLVKFDARGIDGCYKENANGSVEEVFTNTSINNGEVCLSYVTSGTTYTVVETTIPEGYKKMPDATIIATENNNTAENVSQKGLKNTPLYMYFNKIDSKTSNPIIGAEFEVYKNNSLVKFSQKAGEDCYIENENGNITKLYSKNIIINSTNEDGSTSRKQVNGGVCLKYVSSNTKYKVIETNPKDGYTFFKPEGQESGIKIEVNNLNVQTNYNLDETPRGNSEMINYPTVLEFEKRVSNDPTGTDTTITQLIDKALFEIVNSNNQVMTFIEKGNGLYEYSASGNVTKVHTTNRKFRIEYLPWGDYKVREVETNAPEGYYYTNELSNFKITKYTNGLVENMNSAKAILVNKPVEIKFEKKDIYSYYTGEDKAKIESEEKLLDTAKFVLKDINGNIMNLKYVGQNEIEGNIYRYLPVNEINTISEINTYKGKLKITHLKNNTKYIIEEIKGIEGFILPEEHPKKEYNIKREESQTEEDSMTEVIENTPTRIKIEKRDLKTGYLIDDEKVTFELYKKEEEGTLTRIYVTERTWIPDSDGNLEYAYKYSKLNEKTNVRITTYNGTIVFRYLPKGNYVLKEIESPKGYDLPVGELSNTYFEVNDKTIDIDTEVIKNKPSKIIIRKYSEEGYLITGARFKIYKVTNYNPSLSAKDQEKELLKLKTIRQGEYENKEVRDTEEVTTCEKDCELIGTTTNEQGMIKPGELIIQYLDTESYYVIEEVKVPEGYSLPEDPYNIVYLKESVEDKEIDVAIENEYTPITFYKYDEYNKLLDGAEYKLQKLNSNKKYEDISVSQMENKEGSVYIVDYNGKNTKITTTNGSATIYMLAPGQYRVLETKAPEGYELPKASVNIATFFVTDTGKTKGDFIISNKRPTSKKMIVLNKASSELVINISTGQKVMKYIIVIVSLLAGIGLLMFVIHKMNKKV